MTHPPTASTATAAGEPPARRTALAESADRLRAAATTEPGKLRIIGAVLAALVLAFGTVTAWQLADRSAAADDVLHRSQPLSADAAAVYRSLADANTAAASGFLTGGQEPAELRERYREDIETAARNLAMAAANSQGTDATGTASGTASDSSAALISRLNELLPRYTERIETARTYNRQGLPLGGAYLRNANDLMQKEMLPVAAKLYAAEKARLDADYADAKSAPWAAFALGVLALAALVWAQRRLYRRTNRVFNPGLVAATACSTALLLWLAAGHTLAWSGLTESYDQGIRSLNVLNDARISALQARSNENLTLVSRGAVTVPDGPDAGKDQYEVDYRRLIAGLGDGGTDRAGMGSLGEARLLADDTAGGKPVDAAMAAVAEWKKRHEAAREADTQGDYERALERVIGDGGSDDGADGSTGQSFDRADKALARAVAHEQRDFKGTAQDGRSALTGLPVGAGVLAALAAAGAVLGIGRRLSEYR
ncbi:hypothetical protein [Streptomyces sp. NPDC002851]